MDAQVLLLGAVGGVVPDLLRIAKAQGNLGAVGGANVLISMVALAILGAIAAAAADLVQPGGATALASITAGFTGPEVISRLLGGFRTGGGTEAVGTPSRSVLGWWRT